MNEEQLERLGRLVDTCDNLLGAAELPLPPHIHLEGLTSGVTGVRDEIKGLYLELGGEDHWKGRPGHS